MILSSFALILSSSPEVALGRLSESLRSKLLALGSYRLLGTRRDSKLSDLSRDSKESFFLKQSRQNIGFLPVGLNGTSHVFPHLAQVVSWNSSAGPLLLGPLELLRSNLPSDLPVLARDPPKSLDPESLFPKLPVLLNCFIVHSCLRYRAGTYL
jgi:hypothetical protein